jgi:two-component system, OmpR family, KDP operon response regulator KdpE
MTGRSVVLVVEDERDMRKVLLVALQSHGYQVVEASTGKQALTSFRDVPPNVMLLDLGLPDMDGVQVVSSVRREHEVPIIILSARSEEQQQIKALDAGANDYVTKPFREGELMARVRAALRYGPRLKERSEVTVGDVRIDAIRRRVFVREVEIELTATEFKLLHVLACEPGQVLTHGQLLCEVWGPNRLEDLQYLRVYMKQLRRKIEDDPSRPTRIVTELGVGYRLKPSSDR